MKKMTGLLMAIVLVLSMTVGAMADSDTEFTWVIDKGVGTNFYPTYGDGPVQQYWMGLDWDADGDGVGKKISVDFSALTIGSEQDNLNTLLGTGEYPDVMTMNYASQNPASLYEEGIALDLTEYVEKYMPNYLAWLEERPEYKNRLTILNENGERIYVSLYMLYDVQEPAWEGWCYRRDWIVKYGVNPETGAAFAGGYTEDGDWVDDVVFPSGNTDPIYISDWEWMLDIFSKALAAEGIEDGYPLQLYYTGFATGGDLVSSFGGGGALFNLDADGVAQFYGASDNFRAYVECMSNWYSKGWIDPAFQERSGDLMFFMIDTASVYSAKVGAWIGMQNLLGNGLDFAGTGDICVFGAPQPINDIYGGDEQKNKIPDAFYANPMVANGVIITDKAKDKDIATLCTAIDYFYSFEGGLLRGFGFGDNQLDLCDNEFYRTWGFDKTGTYSVSVNEEGETVYYINNEINRETDLNSALAFYRAPGLVANKNVLRTNPPVVTRGLKLWDLYTATGAIGTEITGQLDADTSTRNASIQNNVMTYMSQEIPNFITGVRDVTNDDDWASYCEEVISYGTQSYVDSINEVLK